MENIVTRLRGNKLIIEVDLSVDLGPSRSGNTTVIARTGGNVPLYKNGRYLPIFINCSVFKRRD